MDRPDLSVSADPAGDGSRLGHRPALQVRIPAGPVPLPRGGRANGVHELHHAIRHLHVFLLRLRVELLCRVGVLSALFCGAGHLGFAIGCQPVVAALLLLRAARMALAQPDLLALPAVYPACTGAAILAPRENRRQFEFSWTAQALRRLRRRACSKCPSSAFYPGCLTPRTSRG